jgi:hypothetical protein
VTEDQPVTRREFDMARQAADAEHLRLTQAVRDIDSHGSRGVLQLQDQVTTLVRDVGKLEAALEHHENAHLAERTERARSRKWVIGTGIAALGLLIAILSLIAEIALHIHA